MVAIPEVSAEFAIRAVLDAAHVSEYVLAVGGVERTTAIVATLTGLGLAAAVRERASESMAVP